jgi:hypothetical protein
VFDEHRVTVASRLCAVSRAVHPTPVAAQACPRSSAMSLCRDLRNTRTPARSTSTSNDGNTSAPGQRQLAYGSVTPTPSRGVRRRRDSNDLDYNLDDDLVITRPAGTAPITPGTTKRLKASCEDTARLFDVDADQLRSFAEVR